MAKNRAQTAEKRLPHLPASFRSRSAINDFKRVPCTEAASKGCQAVILRRKDYECIRVQALDGLLTPQEKEKRLNEAVRERERLLAESLARREKIRQLDLEKLKKNQANGRHLNEIEAEARERSHTVLERANKLKLEQEEEIQLCNKLILETKCRAIRDVQVAEKKLIEQELSGEERRLDSLMERERRQKIDEEKRKIAEETLRRQTYARLLKDQIIENEEQRIIDFERKQEEGRLLNLSNIAWQDEEALKAAKKRHESALKRQEFAEENDKLIKLKLLERAENEILDRRIRDFQQKKRQQEEALAETAKRTLAHKHREINRVSKQIEEKQNLQAQIEKLNELRVREEVEREWRRKEKEAAVKAQEARRRFVEAQREQVLWKKTLQAAEMERDRREFEAIVAAQKAALQREQEQREQQRREGLRYRQEILRQVDDKERRKLEARRMMFEEGLAMRCEAETRAKTLREAMERKCQEMRENKVPEMYINDVRRLMEKIK